MAILGQGTPRGYAGVFCSFIYFDCRFLFPVLFFFFYVFPVCLIHVVDLLRSIGGSWAGARAFVCPISVLPPMNLFAQR